FEDSDRFEEDSLCSFISEAESLCQNWRGRMRGESELGGGGAAGPAWASLGSCPGPGAVPDRELPSARGRAGSCPRPGAVPDWELSQA
ncbi:hypothetical protein EGM_18055, partial [Macaca fascicularis]